MLYLKNSLKLIVMKKLIIKIVSITFLMFAVSSMVSAKERTILKIQTVQIKPLIKKTNTESPSTENQKLSTVTLKSANYALCRK